MTETSRPKGLYSFFITIAGFYYLYAVWKAFNSDEISKAIGSNYLYVTLLLIIGTIIWQSRQVEKISQRNFKDILFSNDIEKPKKWALIFSILVGVIFFLTILLAQCVVWLTDKGLFYDCAVSITVKFIGLHPDNEVPSLIWLIIEIIILFIYSTVISASVFMALFMGTTFTCFSVIIALHNWLNGGSFDIGIFLNALFDLGLSDTLSYIVVIGQFILSQYITKNG
jgi:hypothetical protein